MARPVPASVKTISLESGIARLLLIVPLVCAVVWGWFGARWYLANVISEVVTTGDAPNVDLARLATRWGPADPFTHWRLGVVAQTDFSAANVQETVRQFAFAVKLSPNDFRFWDEYGRALEMSGDPAAAEKALQRSVELAPNYYYPRWHLGNLLLREGKFTEAFPHLFRAASANEELWPQVFNLAWQAYDQDVDRIANDACKESSVRALFSIYLVGVKKFDDAVRLWKTLSVWDRSQLLARGQALRKALIDAKQFRAALEITRDVEADVAATAEPEKIVNGGFEDGIVLPTNRFFGWTIGTTGQAAMSIEYSGHNSAHSLQIIFNAANKLDRVNVAQTIVVQPNTQYRLEYFVRTEKINSATPPVVIVLDTSDGNMLAASPAASVGTNDWKNLSVDFKTKNSDAITMYVGRLPCSVGDICPLFGTVWYDDFVLKRGGGPRSDGPDAR
jgi:tetratricopeptide (TPR) repeat protein